MSQDLEKSVNTTGCGPHRAGLVVVLCLAIGAINASAQSTIKCWNNHEGVRECGNTVPPEFAQQGHETKSAAGVTVGRRQQAMTVEQLETERAERRAAMLAAEEKRREAVKDQVLLDTFSSEDDMILARDGQISHLQSQVKITESHIDKLKKSLEELIQEAADHERRGKQPPEKLVADIGSLRAQIRDNAKFIETKEIERTDISAKFDRDIDRFRKLKGLDAALAD
jgi:Txe/YoeB family toxin of Txe-Axe toxin-antitoxin module